MTFTCHKCGVIGFRILSVLIGTFLLSIIIIACGFSGNAQPITFKVIKKYQAVTIDEIGEIEAKKSYNIITPNLNHQSLKIAYLVPEGQRIKKEDLVVQLESETIENIYITANNELEIAKAEAEKRKTELDLERLLLESQVKSLEATVEVSRLRLVNLSFEPKRKQEIEKLEIEKNEIDLDKLKNKLASLEAIQKEERLRFQIKIKQEKNKRDQAEEHLKKLAIFAPVDGLVIFAENWWGDKIKEGDQLHPNQSIAEIPDLSIMQLKLKLGETAAQKCKEGQKAEISSYAFNGKILSGKVSKVNRMAKPIRRRSKVKKVEVIIELDSSNISIAPGISASGKIFIREKEEAFAIPYECLFSKDSLKIVYIRKGSHFEPLPIEVNRRTEEFVLIKAGFKNGDEIAFQQPDEDEIEWSAQLTKFKAGKLKLDSSSTKILQPGSSDTVTNSIDISK